jgi:dUTP pyrophosphatase
MNPDDAGFDLHALEPVAIPAGQRASVGTGIAVAVPDGHAGLVLPRSGHAARHGVTLTNAPGLIDAGYRGEIRVLLINHGHDAVFFEAGDRIAQLLITAVPEFDFVEVASLPESGRGGGGFGSTGR